MPKALDSIPISALGDLNLHLPELVLVKLTTFSTLVELMPYIEQSSKVNRPKQEHKRQHDYAVK